MEKNKSKPVLTVKKIKIISLQSQDHSLENDSSELRFSLTHNIKFSADQNIINLELSASYSHTSNLSKSLFDITVQNIFELTELASFIPIDKDVTTEEMNIPEPFLIKIADLSVSHTRALVSQHTSGTLLDGFYVPIINPRDLAKHIFGDEKVKSK